MFGTFRFYLALLVVARHLVHVPNVGEYAVSGFFVLSGYLMTLITMQSYGFTKARFFKFWGNRILRLYPNYLIIFALSLLIVAFVGPNIASSYQANLIVPSKPAEIFHNITMIYPMPFPSNYPVRLSPTTWALTIELFFYLLISLGLSRTKTTTTIWLSASIIYTFYFIFFGSENGFDRGNLYYSLFAGSLPFSIGAFLYYMPRPKIKQLSDAWALCFVTAIVSVIALNAVLSAFAISIGLSPWIQTASFLLNMIFSAGCIYFLLAVAPSKRMRTLDKWLGDLSYPIYLVHIQLGLLVAYFVMENPATGRFQMAVVVFIVATFLSILFSASLSKFVDERVDRIRTQVRGKPSAATAP